MLLVSCSGSPAALRAAQAAQAPAQAPTQAFVVGGSAGADATASPVPSAAAVPPAASAQPTVDSIAPDGPTPVPTAAPTADLEPPGPTAAPMSAPTEAPAPATTPEPAVVLTAVAGATSDATVSGPAPTPTHTLSTRPNPLEIEIMRRQSYPGSDIAFEQTLAPGANYSQYIVSYLSDGLKIYALMTIPNGPKPATGWPVIIFNHGYIPPSLYRTTERYVAYVDAIARSGYIVFKSDYRGHGSSQGSAEGGPYATPAYTADVLNALASLKAYKDADPQRIGMWGHSMGGQVTLRAMVVSKDIKAGVIWGGVVAPYPDLITHWTRRAPLPPGPASGRRWRTVLIAEYGTPEQNPGFWASISPNSYVADLSGPLQLHASVTDEEVPVAFSQTLYQEAQAAGKSVELFTYPGDNHNISANFNTAMARSIAFFDMQVKNASAAGQ
jgi:uncharacterized protein